MANPKRRHSKSRRDKRRANWKISLPDLSFCPQCKEPKLPHHVCLHCGFYNGKEVIKIKEKKEKKEKDEKKQIKEKKEKKEKDEKKQIKEKKGRKEKDEKKQIKEKKEKKAEKK